MITYQSTDNGYTCTADVYREFVLAQLQKIKQPKLFQ